VLVTLACSSEIFIASSKLVQRFPFVVMFGAMQLGVRLLANMMGAHGSPGKVPS